MKNNSLDVMSKMSMNDVAEIFTAVEVKEQEVQRFRRIIQTGRHFLYTVSLWSREVLPEVQLALHIMCSVSI